MNQVIGILVQIKILCQLGTLVHVCNPSYLGGFRQEDHKCEASLGSIVRPPQKKKKIMCEVKIAIRRTWNHFMLKMYNLDLVMRKSKVNPN
jgi:hypothetical protein